MPRVNPQRRNVGNQGDILKHAALVELASLLAVRTANVRYVDTCTFLLEAPPADAARWGREVDALAAAHPACARYAARERDAIARTGRYRCSAGLVLDVLGERRGATSLGEVDPATRVALRQQIAAEGLTGVSIHDDAAAALEGGRADADDDPRRAGDTRAAAAGAVLVHVDPFALSPALWARLAPGLDAVCTGASDVVVVVYRYTRTAGAPWPPAPAGTLGPVADVLRNPHEVAVYASDAVAEATRATVAALGWRLPRG